MTPSGKERVGVVLLHGYDSRPGAWVPFVEELHALLPADVDIHLLTGPVSLGEVSAGAGPSFAWFDEDQEQYTTADAAVPWVREQLLRNSSAGPLVIVGFSQGGAVGLACAFDSVGALPVRAVVAIGAFLPDGVSPVAFGGSLTIIHGEHDAVVDVMFAEQLDRRARAAGIDTRVHMLDGGHEIPLAAVQLVAGVVRAEVAALR